MAANAPYFQIRSGRLVTTPSSTNATPSHFVPEDDEYDPSVSDVASPHEHTSASYYERPVRQTSADTPVNTSEENHNLADLLKAATTAAGQAAQAMDAQDAGAATRAAQEEGKRKRNLDSHASAAAETSQTEPAGTTKRRRVDVPTDPQLQATEQGSRASSKSNSVPLSGESLLNEARSTGVHSAAALFRRTSDKTATRKYTRPPMSKLFMSLQLTPENFLQLQAQAKTYMLDTTYLERQNCVGNRGKGDTDMVKLRLFNCVRDFLSDGAGEQFFGENVEKPGEMDAIEAARALGEHNAPGHEERLTWPRDGNKIISLVTPLMRRMVTNERQRMYAIETRKGGAKKKDKDGSVEAVAQQVVQSPSDRNEHAQLLSASDTNLRQRSEISQPVSPSVPTPITARLTSTTPMDALSLSVEDDSHHSSGLRLPTDNATRPSLSNINIFLVFAPHLPSGDELKPSVKLDQTRLSSTHIPQLTTYPWQDFASQVTKLLTKAKTSYPAIRARLAMRQGSSTAKTDTLTDNLQELAAAANAMQGDDTDPLAKEPTHEAALLPRHVIKTVGPTGWEYIADAEQWADLLARRSREVWADGVVNVVVELVDVGVEEVGEDRS
ncbi:hypothetical protein HBI13_004680 [Parastagonospora nodorum]|nr:hypothetical protein HBH52_153290 [Parastagonospora nodorum]KAH4005530.1 hypothetical protein HBI10_034430 [Parastagonospora nodorum]KAH4032986.1 hypothetical protein HBI13_004680 [Parastagonospora nodorum]KAH4111339.1 hypothetical protein HBH46_004230 [Parastagonospora nodorum]KAH4208059.1 hypothetical protein HBI95_098980 [Parastagonospora nodorum]